MKPEIAYSTQSPSCLILHPTMYNVQCTILNENPATKNNNKIESKPQEYHKRQTTDSSENFSK